VSLNPQFRLGVVSYLNSRPLIAGLAEEPDLELVFDVPARLPERLTSGDVDVALVPVIDLMQRGSEWQIVSDACIGCDGETLTVRVFSRVPPERITRLHVDGDSHTSVALARILWQERYGRRLEVHAFTGEESAEACEAVLLIGDKVINNALTDYATETDLGLAWKELTSLPFVFAAWAAPRGMDRTALARRLSAARDRGVASASVIAADVGPAMGWPAALARRYLTRRLTFHLGERQREGMHRFFELARRHAIAASTQEFAAV
jgi:chorismate dehydratase